MGKRISLFLLVIIVSYIIYYDLTVGTFHNTTIPAKEVATEVSNEDIPYKIIEIKSGDTLLSIVEQLTTTTTIPSSEQIVHDFQLLNPETSPTKLIIGKSYKIPIYSISTDNNTLPANN